MPDRDGLTDVYTVKEHQLIDKACILVTNNKMLMEIGELIYIIITAK